MVGEHAPRPVEGRVDVSTWHLHLSLTIPVGLILRVVGAYVAMGALLAFPLDRALFAMFRRRGVRRSYLEHIASRKPKWYPGAILKWPAAVASVMNAAYRWKPGVWVPLEAIR